MLLIRDRPFNLQRGGGGGGCYGFLFRSKKNFRTTRELEFFFLQNLILGYMTKTLNQIIFFSLHQNFSATLGIGIFFLEKTITPTWKLNGPSLRHLPMFISILYHIFLMNKV